MATESDLQELLTTGPSFPFLSVYMDLGPQSRATRAYEVILRKRFSALGRLPELGTEEEKLYWSAVGQVWDYARNSLPSTGRGAAVFVAPRLGFFKALAVVERFETQAALEETAFVQPLAHVVEEHEHHLVVETSADRASIYMIHLRAQRAVSKLAELESEVPGKTAKGGFAGWSQKRFQLHRQDHILRHLKKVADAAASLDAQYNAVGLVILGQDQTVSELRRILPQRLVQKIVATGPETSGLGDGPLLQRVLPLLRVEEAEEEKATFDRLTAELARGGLAVSGAEGVTAAMIEGRVDLLLVDEAFHAPGYRCTRCHALMTPAGDDDHCIYCGGEVDEVDLGEALASLAAQQGAGVETAAGVDLERLGGVAALLRY